MQSTIPGTRIHGIGRPNTTWFSNIMSETGDNCFSRPVTDKHGQSCSPLVHGGRFKKEKRTLIHAQRLIEKTTFQKLLIARADILL